MASGFGTTYISSTRCSSGGAVVAATLSQNVNASARTVTVTLRVTAAYYRSVNKDWIPGAGVAVYGSDHTGNRVVGRIGDTTTTLKTGGKVGLQSVASKTYKYNTKYSIPAGEVAVRSGYEADWYMSKTYSYNDNGDAITDSWFASMYLPGQGTTTSEIGGTSSKFTTDSIAANVQVPSGLSVTGISTSTNSVTGTYKVTNWGNETDTSKRKMWARVLDASSDARREIGYTNTSSATATITNSSTAAGGGITIKGAGQYRTDVYASNSAGGTSSAKTTVYTVPNAPSISYTQTQQSTNVKVNVTITGSSNNTSNTVTTYWRSTVDGSAGNWNSYTGAANGTKNDLSFTCGYGKSVKIEAYQKYQNSYTSTTTTVTFTATTGTAPSGLTLSIDGSTWNSITLSGSCSYGKPDGINGRYMCLGVNANGTSLAGRTENGYSNATSGSGIVNNSSTKKDGGVNLKGMLPVYPYIYANNTVKNTLLLNTAYYLPPAPGQFSYTFDGADEYVINFSGVAANNVANYTQADLTRTFRYKIDNGNWVYVDNAATKTIDAVSTVTVTVPPQSTITAEAYHTYKSKNSSTSNFTATNSNLPVKLYGSVNGEAEEIVHFYGGVYDENSGTYKAKKIKKLYASVNGMTKKIFEDYN